MLVSTGASPASPFPLAGPNMLVSTGASPSDFPSNGLAGPSATPNHPPRDTAAISGTKMGSGLSSSAMPGMSTRAGMSRPMITFSLRPSSQSWAPLTAAWVNTLVVSWNEAAERKLSVSKDARVTPSSTGLAVAGSPPSERTLALWFWKANLSTIWPGMKSESPVDSTETRRSICRRMISICLS